jgi:hypothetical protein
LRAVNDALAPATTIISISSKRSEMRGSDRIEPAAADVTGRFSTSVAITIASV